jgi:hypothetical protein
LPTEKGPSMERKVATVELAIEVLKRFGEISRTTKVSGSIVRQKFKAHETKVGLVTPEGEKHRTQTDTEDEEQTTIEWKLLRTKSRKS